MGGPSSHAPGIGLVLTRLLGRRPTKVAADSRLPQQDLPRMAPAWAIWPKGERIRNPVAPFAPGKTKIAAGIRRDREGLGGQQHVKMQGAGRIPAIQDNPLAAILNRPEMRGF